MRCIERTCTRKGDNMTEKEEGSLKRPRKRGAIAAGVIAAVVLVAGVGLFVWHEQPSFCAAICHTPMDAYLDTYNGSTDKYGNELDEQAKLGMMSYLHSEKASTTCLGCHVPTLGEQVSEGIGWVTGNYEVVGYNSSNQWILESKSLDQLTAAREKDGITFCLNEACHTNADGSVMTKDDLIALTADHKRNPHVAQHQELDCGTCHKAHEQSSNYCLKCHDDAPSPEGWADPADAAAARNVSR